MEDNEKKKINEFVLYLLNNPNIKSEPILVGENLILNFIIRNLNQIEKTLISPQFFPNADWQAVLKNILLELQNIVINSISPEFESYFNKISFAVLNKISKSDAIALDYLKTNLKNFFYSIIANKDVRYNFNSVLNILRYKVLERYIPKIFERREFIYNELVKVQRFNISADEYIDLLKIILIIKNSGYIKIPITPDAPDKKINITEAVKSIKLLETFLRSMIERIKKDIPGFSDEIIKLALKSNLVESYTEINEAIPRFLYIICVRFHNYKPIEKIDRGAETPDKSWFNIARKNAEIYGYNKRIAEELYRIAGENNW